MARIAGVDLPKDKRVEIGLTYIYGIGRQTSNKILEATGVNPDTRVKDLTEDEVNAIRTYIEKNCHVEGDLQRDWERPGGDDDVPGVLECEGYGADCVHCAESRGEDTEC